LNPHTLQESSYLVICEWPVKKTLFHGALDMSLLRIWCDGKAAMRCNYSLCHGRTAYHMLLM